MIPGIDSHRIAIIPTYMDNGRIGNVLSRFSSDFIDEVCVVLDSPSESILNEIKSASEKIDVPVNIIQNSTRNGVGYAIREGIQYALCSRYDVIVVLAGNAKDDPKEIPRLLKPIIYEDFDYVQGSRFLKGGKHVRNPLLRRVFSSLYPFVWTLLTNIRCTDVTNGFRAYKTKIFDDKRINIFQPWLDGYGLEYYIHYKALTLGYKTKEIPVSKVYPSRSERGYTKIRPFNDWWQIVSPLIYLSIGAKK